MGRHKLRSPEQSLAVRWLLGLYEFCASLKLAVVLIFTAAAALAVGCRDQDEITRYRVPKPQLQEQTNGGKSESPRDGLTYDVPAGWLLGKSGGLRKAAFRIETGGKEAEVTVIDLDASAADVLSNVNRWREQVELPATTADALSQEMKKLAVGPVAADYVELFGAKQSILGVMVPRDDKVWFIKLKGDTDLVRSERDRFQAFAQSVRFAQ